MKKPNFLTKKHIEQILKISKFPVYIYSYKKLTDNIKKLLDFPNAYGLTVRYALKANSHRAFISTVHKYGIHFDASSEYEVIKCLRYGIPAKNIQLTSQQFPNEFAKEIFSQEVLFNACSLNQLISYGEIAPNSEVSFRVNPGHGSGGTKKTNVGGPSSSFGIWYEQINEVKEIAKKYNLKITRIHSHIGSGSDPNIWKKVAEMTLKWVEHFPEIKIVNLGGGFKFGRMPSETTTDLQEVGLYVKKAFENFFVKNKRKLKLEIEPGTYLTANTGSLVCNIEDIVTTGKSGYKFIKLNTGMDSITRPALYATEHPIIIMNESKKLDKYVVVGHCCESSDVFTINEKEELTPKLLNEATVGDTVIIEYTGAYCSSMSLKNYNSFPIPAELMLKDNQIISITPRQNFSELMDKEKELPINYNS